MPLFIPNSKLGKVRNEFAIELTNKYGTNAKEVHDTLDKIAITFARASYPYLMSMLSPLEKGTVLTQEQLEELYNSMTEKFNVTYKQVYGSIVCAFRMSWKYGDMKTLVSMFGRERLYSYTTPENLEYINAILKYVSDSKDDIIVY